MSCGQDKCIKLWNPFRETEDGKGFLIKNYQGPHGYGVYDVAMYSIFYYLFNYIEVMITVYLHHVVKKKKYFYGMFQLQKF